MYAHNMYQSLTLFPPVTTSVVCSLFLLYTLQAEGDIDFKSSYLYENLLVQTKNGHFVKEIDTSGYIVV